MSKFSVMTICMGLSFAFALAGCASKPASPVSASKATGKVAKQRSVAAKVPVLVKETSFYSDGLVDVFVLYKLDDAKKAVIERDKFDATRADPIERAVFEYKDGRETAETIYESDGKLRNRRELGYDAAGRMASDRVLDAQGKAQSGSAYSYDASGRKVEWRALDGSGATKALSAYAYGKDGLNAVEMQNSGGAPTGSIKLEYSGGNLSKRSYFGADKVLQKYEAYAYSGSRVSAVETRGADGSLVVKIAYEYGSLGELVKATEYSASGSVSGYTTYEYVVREDASTETYYE
jgi:antitoxin component YwqK of YwqJK toxin-antitoxin module